MASVTKAFVLAGGKGTRLRPFTYEIPKPMLPVKGKPIIEYNLKNLEFHGVKEVVLGVGYKADLLKKYFEREDFGLKIHYSLEEKPLGTAGALKKAESFFDSEKRFFMCNGDEVKEIDYSKLLKVHEKNNALATLALMEVEDSSQFGSVELNGERIVSFEEKTGEKKAGTVSMGAYVLDSRVFELIPENKEFSIEKEVFPLIAKKEKLFGCKMNTQFFPTDNPKRYERAIMEWKGMNGGE